MTGLVHIYCGAGKGKTSAAAGAAIRAAGRGIPVTIARFLKHDDSGEVAVLSLIPEITLIPCSRTFGFSWTLDQQQKEEAGNYYGRMLQDAFCMAGQTAVSSKQGLLVLDEALGACSLGFLKEEELIRLLKERPPELEVILTGRNPSKALLDQADYITEMTMVRHPYEKGIGARRGIEY